MDIYIKSRYTFIKNNITWHLVSLNHLNNICFKKLRITIIFGGVILVVGQYQQIIFENVV